MNIYCYLARGTTSEQNTELQSSAATEKAAEIYQQNILCE